MVICWGGCPPGALSRLAGVFLFSLLGLPCVCSEVMADEASTSSEDSSEALDDLSNQELWARLPRRFRAEFGRLGGELPCISVLGFLVDSQHDMCNLMSTYADNSGAREAACTLWSRAQNLAASVCKRRARVDPAWQRVLLAKRSPPTALAGLPGLDDTLSWLRQKSGARRSKSMQRALRCAEGQSREDIDKQRLARWRRELVEIILEANLPIVANAQMASCPQSVIEASLGCARYSTIRKRVREWRALRTFSIGACGAPWPAHIGVVLDYLQERVEEPCGRTIPEAILATLAFFEKVGCVLSADRLCAAPICGIWSTKPRMIWRLVLRPRARLPCCRLCCWARWSSW